MLEAIVPPDSPAEPEPQPEPEPRDFTALYHQLANPIYARLTRILGPVPEREDLLQQVFLQLHRALPTYRGDADIATFVHRIAINQAYDHLRSRKRRPALPADAPELDELVADAPSPAVRTQRREELAQLFEDMQELTADKRIALVLVAVEGLSLREAADLVGATPDAVKQRVLHARRELIALAARKDNS